jgi:hypothetical protein
MRKSLDAGWFVFLRAVEEMVMGFQQSIEFLPVKNPFVETTVTYMVSQRCRKAGDSLLA